MTLTATGEVIPKKKPKGGLAKSQRALRSRGHHPAALVRIPGYLCPRLGFFPDVF